MSAEHDEFYQKVLLAAPVFFLYLLVSPVLVFPQSMVCLPQCLHILEKSLNFSAST